MSAGAIQPRINKAIEDRLRGDTLASSEVGGVPLAELLRAEGATLSQGIMPLYWWMAPASAERPHLIYGPQARESETQSGICAVPFAGEVLYEVRYVVDGIDPSPGIAVLDRLAELLDAYAVEVGQCEVLFSRTGEFCYPDFAASERAASVSGIVFRCHVNLGE